MKKLTAMLLVLCMLLAAVPALAGDVSGMWYITLAEVTLGYFQLNEDGTVEAQIPGQDAYTGTWTADGDKVTVTIDGAPMDFTYDGTSLSSEEFPIPVVREEGKLSAELVGKVISNEEYELPEGMTQAELALIALNFMTEYQRILSAASSSGSTESEKEPAADPELTVVKEDFRIVESFNGYRAMYIAKVRNDTDTELYIRSGSMKLTDAEGNLVSEATYLYTCGSKYVEPGETTFISFQADMSEMAEVNVEKNIEVATEGYYTKDRAVTAENPEIRKAVSYEGDSMRVTVTNDTDAPLSGFEAVFVLEDAEGNLLQVSTESVYRHELNPGSSITMVSSIDSRVLDYCKANGIEPAVVEAYAWTEIRDY